MDGSKLGGYVTNATSKSVAFYVISFLNNSGYTAEQIIAIGTSFKRHTAQEGSALTKCKNV